MSGKRIAKGFFSPKKDRPGIDLALTVSEVIADANVADATLEAIPFVDLVFKVLKAKDAIADALYARKLVGFIRGIGDLSDFDRNRIAEELIGDEGTKVGETLLLVLDRVTDLEKPELLGFLFRQFSEKRITGPQLRRLSEAVDAGFADDLQVFLDPDQSFSEAEIQDCRRHLTHTGLTVLTVLTGWDAGPTRYDLTDLGELFFELVRDFGPGKKT